MTCWLAACKWPRLGWCWSGETSYSPERCVEARCGDAVTNVAPVNRPFTAGQMRFPVRPAAGLTRLQLTRILNQNQFLSLSRRPKACLWFGSDSDCDYYNTVCHKCHGFTGIVTFAFNIEFSENQFWEWQICFVGTAKASPPWRTSTRHGAPRPCDASDCRALAARSWGNILKYL